MLRPRIERKIKRIKTEKPEFLSCTPLLTKLLEDHSYMKKDQEALISALVSHMETVEPPEVDQCHYNLDPDGSHM